MRAVSPARAASHSASLAADEAWPSRMAVEIEVTNTVSERRLITSCLRVEIIMRQTVLSPGQSPCTPARSQHGFLTYHAASRGHTGEGKVRLIPDYVGEVLSVISDIDDTDQDHGSPGRPSRLISESLRTRTP